MFDFETIASKVKAFLPSAQLILDVATNLAKVVPGTSEVVGAVELGVKIANGIANNIPDAIQVYKDVKEAVAGGRQATTAEWAAWRIKVQEAHDSFTAAADRVINS